MLYTVVSCALYYLQIISVEKKTTPKDQRRKQSIKCESQAYRTTGRPWVHIRFCWAPALSPPFTAFSFPVIISDGRAHHLALFTGVTAP